MNRIWLAYFALLCLALPAAAQYAPQAGINSSTAISKNSSQIVGWAGNCSVQRGYLDIAQPSLGTTSAGDSSLATGVADNYVVSLGDSGVATLVFSNPIVNGAGFDFAVFENGFPNPGNSEEAFLELAFVEVSSDGSNFFRFPASSLTQDTFQLSSITGLNYMNARLINNLAGKYVGNFGTPFDLQELAGTPGLNVNRITHVRIVDVVGRIDGYSSYDTAGNKINDPYPTDFPTGGFDLDAVGVLHQAWPSSVAQAHTGRVSFFPNPATDAVTIEADRSVQVLLTDITGKTLQTLRVESSKNFSLEYLHAGIYLLHFSDDNGTKWVERLLKR